MSTGSQARFTPRLASGGRLRRLRRMVLAVLGGRRSVATPAGSCSRLRLGSALARVPTALGILSHIHATCKQPEDYEPAA